MKNLLVIAVLAALGGCATTPDGRYGYQQPGYGAPGYGAPGYGAPGDPSQWRVVSVTPVPLGTGERVARETGSTVQYSSTPVQVVPAPVYEPAPVYVPQPAYVYPPVTFSLGLMLGKSWGGHRHHHRGYRRHR